MVPSETQERPGALRVCGFSWTSGSDNEVDAKRNPKVVYSATARPRSLATSRFYLFLTGSCGKKTEDFGQCLQIAEGLEYIHGIGMVPYIWLGRESHLTGLAGAQYTQCCGFVGISLHYTH